MNDTLIIVNIDATIQMVNKSTLDILGYKEHELIGKPVGIIIAKEKETLFSGKGIENLIKKGFITGVEKTYLTKDGRKIPVLFSGSVMRDAEGNIQGIICAASNIADRKQAEEVLKAAIDYSENIFNSTGSFIRTIDMDFNIIKINHTMTEFLGKTMGKSIGIKCYDQLHGEFCHTDNCTLKHILSGEKLFTIEVVKEIPDGRKYWFHLSATPLVKNDKIIGIVESFQDISDRKLAEEEIEKAHKELIETTAQIVHSEKLNALGELTAGITHELNQPLNNIKIVCQDLLRDIGKNRLDINILPDDLKDLVGQVNKMAEIINHMRVYSRYTDSLYREEIDIIEPLNNLFLLLGEQLRIHNINIIKDFAPGLPKISGDLVSLEQVFINLIVNARNALENFRKKERKIEIKSFLNNKNEVVISIKDNGGGVPALIRDRIFEPFFTTKPAGKGTGLGLSISKKIIEEHNGKIELEVEQDEGSTFTVILPACE